MCCVLQTHACLPGRLRKLLSVQVCSESTSHAEAIQKMYDPQQAERGKLVDLLFSSYSSTTYNRASNDVSSQERSSR